MKNAFTGLAATMLTTLLTTITGLTSLAVSSTAAASCPAWMDQSFKQLHSSNTINLCDEYNSKPLLIVNTASHCGFTHQFSGLEALQQRYQQEGLRVVGFASNDFRQAAKSEAEAASICYENYGVTFTMMAPISVKGGDAHPLFKTIAAKSQAPSWNFNKFLVSADGSEIKHFGSSVSPESSELNEAIKRFL